MRRTQLVAALLVCAVIGLPRTGSAQSAAPPTILNVTMDATGGQLTISGTGFGPAPLVTIDGQPVTVLLGATDTQVTVITPSALLTTPGTYRLTVVDSVRQVGEVFAVASRAGLVPGISLTTGGASPVPSGVGATTAQPRTNTGSVGTLAIEDPGSPYTTALGYQAAANTTGPYNTASGYAALFANSTGFDNTASGVYALRSNTTGSYNTASGVDALYSNMTGYNNTASGVYALLSNSTGYNNMASGYAALLSNTTGYDNTASGMNALYSNTTGSLNTASGVNALVSNTTGGANTASGYGALYSNTTGGSNTAGGFGALASNTTGSLNTASGWEALASNTTGRGNTASGDAALCTNTTGSNNTALGTYAGSGVACPLPETTGNWNLYLGAYVSGPTDTNTIRIGLPYGADNSPPSGQNQTFIAGIYGTPITGGVPVVIDADGQLGTAAGLTLANGGNVGIGTATPTNPLEMGNGAYVSVGGVWTNASSRTLKDQIADLPASRALEAFERLKPVTFVYKANPTEAHVGFIAEDVPDLVATQDRKSLAAMDIVAVLTKVAQEQQVTINDLKARLARLESLLTDTAAAGSK